MAAAKRGGYGLASAGSPVLAARGGSAPRRRACEILGIQVAPRSRVHYTRRHGARA